jgi:hypothetical protein
MNNDSNNDISWDEYDKTTYYALCKIWEDNRQPFIYYFFI